MIHIILLILKIIGITVAVILGLLLLVIGVILFVPVRYRADVRYSKTLECEGRVSWLLHLVSFRVWYTSSGSPHIVLKIFGRRFFDNERNEKKSSDNTKSRASKEKRKKERAVPKADTVPKPELVPKADTASAPGPENAAPRALEAVPDVKDLPDTKTVPGAKAAPGAKDLPDAKAVPDAKDSPDVKAAPDAKAAPGIVERLLLKLQALKNKVTGFAAGIMKKLRGVKESLQQLGSKLGKIRDKKDNVLAILFDEKNKPSFLKIKRVIFRVLRHLKPTKFSGQVHFGFDDPATTGYTLGVLSLLYPVCEEHLMLYPDFDRKILEGELHVGGRLCVSVFLMAALRIILDKDIRRIIGSFKNI